MWKPIDDLGKDVHQAVKNNELLRDLMMKMSSSMKILLNDKEDMSLLTTTNPLCLACGRGEKADEVNFPPNAERVKGNNKRLYETDSKTKNEQLHTIKKSIEDFD